MRVSMQNLVLDDCICIYSILQLTTIHITIVEESLNLLRSFKDATEQISTEKFVSGGLVIPLINCIKTSLHRVNVTSDLAGDLKQQLVIQIGKKMDAEESNILLSIATILDPRFKRIHFQSPLNAAKAITVIKEEVRKEQRLQGSITPPLSNNVCNIENENREKKIWVVHYEAAAAYT